MVKNLPANAGDTRDTVQSQGQEDPLEQDMATHSNILAQKNSMDRRTWWATVHETTESDMTECTHT